VQSTSQRQNPPSFAPDRIRVGEVEISGDEILREAQYHPAESFEAACAEASRSLVIRALLLREATRLELISDPANVDERAQQKVIGELLERELPVPETSQPECERFYQDHPEKFRGPELFSASHILLLADASDPDGRKRARERAEELRRELAARPERFEQLARKHSGCPSARSDGALGQIEPGESPAAFEQALRALACGEIASSPVETEHGFHVVRLDARAPGLPLPFASVRDKIHIYLRDRAWRLQLRRYIEGLAAKTEICGYDLR